jgi:hypothetical protein
VASKAVSSASQAGRALQRSSGHSIVLLAADQSRTRTRSQGRSDASAPIALAKRTAPDAIVPDRHLLDMA